MIKELLTIGIPAYNGSSNLEALFASIEKLGLAANRFEILLVDNDSTDETSHLVERIRSSFPSLRFYKNEQNIGRVMNWNRVLELAHGEYILMMNVNDRFMDFDTTHYLNLMDKNAKIAVLMADVCFNGYIYPNWVEEGEINLKQYVRKTFLDPNYLEFHALGILQQHIYRTELIKKYRLSFDVEIPRTTDRVFTAEVIKAGGGIFYYVPKSIVKWDLSVNRYHYGVHQAKDQSRIDEFWENESTANAEIALLTGISVTEIIHAQLIYAKFLMLAKWFKKMKYTILGGIKNDEMEIITADHYCKQLYKRAKRAQVSLKELTIRFHAFKYALSRFLSTRKRNPFARRPLNLISPPSTTEVS